MLIFVELFGGAIDTGAPGDYVTYVAPGVALLCAGFGAASTAVAVSVDLGGGIVDRLRSMDVSGAALLGGHVAASVMRNAVATSLVFAVALALGFRPEADVLQWLGAIGVLLAFVLALSWLSAAIGLLAGSPEAANGFTFFVMFLRTPPARSSRSTRCPPGCRASRDISRSRPSSTRCAACCSTSPSAPRGGRRCCGAGIAGVSIVAAAALFGRRSAR